MTLTASTEDCATDLEMLMVIEEYPRDIRTYGGESTAALNGASLRLYVSTRRYLPCCTKHSIARGGVSAGYKAAAAEGLW